MLLNFNEMKEISMPGMNDGTGKAVCDGIVESLSAGICHICKKDSAHSIENTGEEDLVMLMVVVER